MAVTHVEYDVHDRPCRPVRGDVEDGSGVIPGGQVLRLVCLRGAERGGTAPIGTQPNLSSSWLTVTERIGVLQKPGVLRV